MTTLFEAFQDTTGWTLSAASPDDRALVHPAGFHVRARPEEHAWALSLMSRDDDGPCGHIVSIPRASSDSLVADLDRAFGPKSWFKMQWLERLVWHWILTQPDLPTSDGIRLLRNTCSLWFLPGGSERMLPLSMRPLFEAMQGVVGPMVGHNMPKHGMGMSILSMTWPRSMHERLRLMDPCPVPTLAAFLAA